MEFHSGSGNPDNDVLKSSRINVAQCTVAKYLNALVSENLASRIHGPVSRPRPRIDARAGEGS